MYPRRPEHLAQLGSGVSLSRPMQKSPAPLPRAGERFFRFSAENDKPAPISPVSAFPAGLPRCVGFRIQFPQIRLHNPINNDENVNLFPALLTNCEPEGMLVTDTEKRKLGVAEKQAKPNSTKVLFYLLVEFGLFLYVPFSPGGASGLPPVPTALSVHARFSHRKD